MYIFALCTSSIGGCYTLLLQPGPACLDASMQETQNQPEDMEVVSPNLVIDVD